MLVKKRRGMQDSRMQEGGEGRKEKGISGFKGQSNIVYDDKCGRILRSKQKLYNDF